MKKAMQISKKAIEKRLLTSVLMILWIAMPMSVVNAACPAISKLDAPLGKISDLKRAGFTIYKDKAGDLNYSKLEPFSPTKIVNTNGLAYMAITVDGKWFIATSGKGTTRKAVFIEVNGSGRSEYSEELTRATWFFSSPKENPVKGVFEFAYIASNLIDVYAVMVDFSSGSPKFGAKRQIAKGLRVADQDEFSVAKDIIAWDTRVGRTAPSMLYTIPDQGNGMATESTLYDVYTGYNCAAHLNHAGTVWASNQSRLKISATDNCYFGQDGGVAHSGFFMRKTKKFDEPKVKTEDWCTKESAGALGLNFAPEKVGGFTTRDTKNPQAFEWFAGEWTNRDEYLAVTVASHVTGGPSGLWLNHWPTNTWIPVNPITESVTEGTVWFEGESLTTALPNNNLNFNSKKNLSNSQYLFGLYSIQNDVNNIRNLLGRKNDILSK